MEKPAVQRADGSWLLDGKMLIDEVRDLIGMKANGDDETPGYNTLGGMVMHRMGRVPEAGDLFDVEGFRFEVVDMDGKRVDKVLVYPPVA